MNTAVLVFRDEHGLELERETMINDIPGYPFIIKYVHPLFGGVYKTYKKYRNHYFLKPYDNHTG
jgi:hypothetical protein